MNHVDQNGVLPARQSAYRKFHFTESAMIHLGSTRGPDFLTISTETNYDSVFMSTLQHSRKVIFPLLAHPN